METVEKSTVTQTQMKSIDNDVTTVIKSSSPRSKSPIILTESSTSVTSPSDNSLDHKGDKHCIFCLSKGQAYSEEGLNIHYWRTCPMLTRCEACKQVIEVSYYNSHLLNECDCRNNYVKCDNCKQPVIEKFFDQHSREKNCVKPVEGLTNCPLCHNLINQNKWREHLMGDDPCTNNTRNKLTKSPSKSQNISGKLTSLTGTY